MAKADTTSKCFTPFGQEIGEKNGGFGYNAELSFSATGAVYLRARSYEPAMNRFSQKDVMRGSVVQPGSLNRYSYVQNDPVNFIDPSGQSLKSVWNSVKSAAKNAVTSVKNTVSKVVTTVKNTASKVVSTVKNVATTVSNAAKSAYNQVKTAVSNVFNGGGSSGGSYSGAASGGYAGSTSGSSYTDAVGSSAYTSSGNATSYYNSSRQTGKTPSPDAPRVEDVSPSLAYCNRDTSNSSYILVLSAIAAGEPTPIGEIALLGYLGLIALGVIAISSNTDRDDYQLPNIYSHLFPEKNGDLIEKMPDSGENSGTKPESIPKTEENHTGSIVDPLPEENTDLIVEQEITDFYKWGNLDTLEDHFNRHGNDVGAISPEDYARKANEFYNNRETYQVKVDEEGIIRVYDPVNNIFGAYNSDGTTKTLFSPTDGQSYFDRQDGELQ